MKVFLIILAALLFLLLCPVSVRFTARHDGVSCFVRYLFFRVDLSPEALSRRMQASAGKKASAKQKKKKRADEEEKEAPPKKKKRSVSELLQLGWDLLKSTQAGLRILRKHLVFSRVRLYISVGGEDAHKIAMHYSLAGALVAAVLDIVGLLFVLRTPKVGIAPAFTSTHTRYELSARVGMRPLFLLAGVFAILLKALAVLLRSLRKKPAGQKRPAKAA